MMRGRAGRLGCGHPCRTDGHPDQELEGITADHTRLFAARAQVRLSVGKRRLVWINPDTVQVNGDAGWFNTAANAPQHPPPPDAAGGRARVNLPACNGLSTEENRTPFRDKRRSASPKKDREPPVFTACCVSNRRASALTLALLESHRFQIA